jgi:RNA polymerase sigma-70 factor (family 1)
MSGLIHKAELEVLFKELYQPLVKHSIRFVRQPEIAEEIVQEIFIHIWEKRNELNIHTSYKAYLFTAVRNKSIDYLKSKYAKQAFVSEEFLTNYPESEAPHDSLEEKELDNLITEAIKALPGKCHLVFSMSRFGNYTNKQIAEELNISKRTVETQISVALKRLKKEIEKYLKLIILCFL